MGDNLGPLGGFDFRYLAGLTLVVYNCKRFFG